MQSATTGAGASDQTSGASARPRSRWPSPEPGARYVAVLGGSATLGKPVTEPFTALVAAATGVPVLNLGTPNGGPDAYLSDSSALHLISRADAAVVQLTGAETLSNPYYSVHSRRNDRFLAPTAELQRLYPEVDLTEIHFARHLLQVLAKLDARRFELVVRALKETWVARMETLLLHLPLPRNLLWLSDSLPPDRAERLDPGLGPLFVDAGMLDRLRPLVSDVIVVIPSPEARASDNGPGPYPLHVLPGTAAHREIAYALAPVIAAQVRRPPLLLSKACLVP